MIPPTLRGAAALVSAAFLAWPTPASASDAAAAAAPPAGAPAPAAAAARSSATIEEVLSLQRCVDEALRGGPELRLARATLAVATAVRDQAAAKNAFGLAGNAGATHAVSHSESSGLSATVGGTKIKITSDTPPTDTFQGGLTLSGPLSTSLGLSSSQILTEDDPMGKTTRIGLSLGSTLWDGYPGGRSLADLRQADMTLASKRAADEASRKTIVYNVKQAYYAMLGQARQREILSRSLEARSEELRRTEALLAADKASRVDVKQARLNRSQAELDLAKAARDLELARERLSALMGWPLDRRYSLEEAAELPLAVPEVEAAIGRALAGRVELVQLLAQQSAGRIALALARSLSSPTVNATGSMSWSKDWTNDRTSNDWSVGLKLNCPILDAGTIEAQSRQAAAQLEAYGAQRDQLAASISTQAKAAVYDLRDALARVELARASLDLARDQLELAAAQLALGKISNLEYLAASVAATTAEAGLAKARSDAQLKALALLDAMGE